MIEVDSMIDRPIAARRGKDLYPLPTAVIEA